LPYVEDNQRREMMKLFARIYPYMAVLMMLAALTACKRPIVTEFSPKLVTPGEQVIIKGKNFDRNPLQIQFGTVPANIIHKTATVVLAEVPYAAGKAPVKVSNPYGTFKTSEKITIRKARGLRYPKDRPVQFPVSRSLFSLNSGINEISPFGQNAKYLVMVGVPSDISTQFTFAELEQKIRDEFSVVRDYWSTISKTGTSLADVTVYPKLIPLPKKFNEYIDEFTFPIARGTIISSATDSIDFRGITDRTVSITVTGPTGSTNTISTTLPSGDFVRLSDLQNAFLSRNILTYFVKAGPDQVAIDVQPRGQADTLFAGNGYLISSLTGTAWSVLGLFPPAQLFPGTGVRSSSNGFDTGIDLSWEDEIFNAVNTDTSFDGSQYDGLVYMLVNVPALQF
jgi:hypothetical protein